jgi:hypothetical protein
MNRKEDSSWKYQMTARQLEEDDDEAFMRSLTRCEEDRRRLYPSTPWDGGFRWFRSPNVIPLEKFRGRNWRRDDAS